MSYSISIEECNEYIHVSFSGDAHPDESKALWTELTELIKDSSSKNFLVERLPGTKNAVPGLVIYEVFRAIADATVSDQARVAVLYPPDISPETIRDIQFGESVASNRGGNLRAFFHSKDDAKDWLLKQKK